MVSLSVVVLSVDDDDDVEEYNDVEDDAVDIVKVGVVEIVGVVVAALPI